MDKFDSVLIYLDVVDNSRLEIHTNSSRDIIAMIALGNIWVILRGNIQVFVLALHQIATVHGL